MNKITIPALLLGVVMIAGAFAFMPVQEASTVHTGATTTLAADAITAAKIATDSIGATEIAANAIGAAEIANASIDAATFAAGAVNAAAIGADAITAAKIADDAIVAANIATDAITAAKIAADSIGASEIAANAIGAAEIGADAITAAKIADDAILAVNIATNAVGHLELADGVEPLSNVLSAASADLNAAGLNATCGAGGDAFLVHYIVVGANGDVLEIDINDNNTADLELVLLTATLMQTGTVAGAAGATVEISGDDGSSTIKAIVTVQCTGNGTAAIS